MSAKWHDRGENWVLGILLGSVSVSTYLYMGLYKNAVELEEGDELASITEPSGYGYARKQLPRGSWAITDDVATFAQQTFLAAGGPWGDITGYFITTTADNSGLLVASEHFTNALAIADGKGIKITPKITVK
jgi:hypothetical protein